MTGASWMNFGIYPQMPQGDFETKVYRFIAK